jgi:hypothetical protein
MQLNLLGPLHGVPSSGDDLGHRNKICMAFFGTWMQEASGSATLFLMFRVFLLLAGIFFTYWACKLMIYDKYHPAWLYKII